METKESESSAGSSKWIKLNVGGELFTTTRLTLTNREPNSMIARMFASDQQCPSDLDSQGAYLIDRNGHYFRPILDYLRHGRIIHDKNVSLEGIMEEAKFYGLEEMIKLITDMQKEDVALTRLDFIRALVTSSHTTELRFQGVHLAGINLSRLDLRNINFKYACLSNCDLSHANLSNCCLERANLRHANLEGAKLHSVLAMCADLEHATLKYCDFADPSGSRCNLESSNLKGAILEGSIMEGVNLRVANLKNANMRFCELNYADMAGANLEACDLSGSNLKGANLRGANLKEAHLELMAAPVHMAQIDIY